MEEGFPTEVDFEKLRASIKSYDAMDEDKLYNLQVEYHLHLPDPYSVAVQELDFADPGVLGAIHEYIEIDPELSDEEKYALRHELSDRHRTAHLAMAPEGWND